MEETTQNENKNNKLHTVWKVHGIFTITIILICAFVFIINYNNAYDDDTGGGWLPPSFAVVFYYFCIVITSVVASIVLKLVLKKRVRILALLLISVLLPIICYNYNYHAFKSDGFLYPLVDEGGAFRFLAIGDYNFDGINDEEYHLLYEERQYSSRYGGHFDDTIIDYIDTTATGTGLRLDSCFCFYDWEDGIIDLHLNKYSVKLKQINITVAFQDPTMAQRVSFWLEDSELNYIINSNDTVSIVFDADSCAAWQDTSDKEFIKISIKYVLNN